MVPAMDGENSRLGSAQVRWNDYVGTAAADDADVLLNTRSLYELAGLDRERWVVVGLDFALGGAAEEALVVYATPRPTTDAAGSTPDRLDVTAFVLGSSVELDQFLAQAFKKVSVRLLSSTVSDAELHVTGRVHADHETP